MPRRKNLNGIPHNITQSFFGTERYYRCGYMGDWLLNAARKPNITKASLNVLQASFSPTELNIHPLTYNAKTLKTVIDKEVWGECKLNCVNYSFLISCRKPMYRNSPKFKNIQLSVPKSIPKKGINKMATNSPFIPYMGASLK